MNSQGMIGQTGWWPLAGWILRGGPYWLTFFATLITIISGYIYIRENLDLFNEGRSL